MTVLLHVEHASAQDCIDSREHMCSSPPPLPDSRGKENKKPHSPAAAALQRSAYALTCADLSNRMAVRKHRRPWNSMYRDSTWLFSLGEAPTALQQSPDGGCAAPLQQCPVK